MKTKRPNKEWRELLNKKRYTRNYPHKNKSLEKLKHKLLKIAGWAVILPETNQLDIEEYLTRGKKFHGKSKLKLGQPSQCHHNSSLLWLKSKEKIKICTGFALSDDGVWRVHSWGLEKDKIIETTEKRLLYYGYVLSRIESAFFVQVNGVDLAKESELIEK